MKQRIKGFLAVLLTDMPSCGWFRLLLSLRGNRRNPKNQEYPSCIPM